MADVDVVVIGSGAGGLTAAVALAQAGKKVLVLEQHDVPGGWCHSFRLGGHMFSPGVHYVGECGPGGRMRQVWEGLGIANDLLMLELNPEGYDHVVVGRGATQQRFDIPKGRDHYAERLKQRFPKEARGIDRYLTTVEAIVHDIEVMSQLRGRLAPLTLPIRAPSLVRWGLRPIKSLLDACVADPFLRAILTIQAGDHGLGPEDAPAAVHASVQQHYFGGGWYPRGGGAAIPRALVKALKRAGGDIQLKARVDRILVEGGRAVGVRLADGQEIRTDVVLSNADPGITYGRMMDPADVPAPVARKLARTKWSISCLSLYMAADIDPATMGLDSGNLWYSAGTDIQAGYRLAQAAAFDVPEFPGQFLTCTTCKDPSKGLGTSHTFESFVFVSHDAFKRWAHSRFGERPADYSAYKEELTAKMLKTIDRHVPGLSERVTFRELGTPLTNEHYVMATQGNLYGTEKSLRQLGPFSWPVRTPVPGLFMCGASTTSHGVMGATMSGLAAAARVLHVRGDTLLRASNQHLRTLPSDDLSAWPEDLRARIALKHRSDEAAGAADATE